MQQIKTFDTVKEFPFHKKTAEQLNTQVFFSYPYSAWEKATIESFNAQYRFFILKKTDFCQLSNQQLLAISDILNNKPRKCLNYKTLMKFY